MKHKKKVQIIYLRKNNKKYLLNIELNSFYLDVINLFIYIFLTNINFLN
jgi:hypothetical protein